jgi:hypothetical protein
MVKDTPETCGATGCVSSETGDSAGRVEKRILPPKNSMRQREAARGIETKNPQAPGELERTIARRRKRHIDLSAHCQPQRSW